MAAALQIDSQPLPRKPSIRTTINHSVEWTPISGELYQATPPAVPARPDYNRGAPMSIADRRVAEWLFLLTFATYAYFYAGGGWNQNSNFDLTRAIVERHTFAIDAYVGNTGDVSFANGHVYANKAPALSWVAAIPYAAIYAVESARGIDPGGPIALTLNAYLCTLVCVAIPGALIPAMLYAFARRRGAGVRWAAAVALIVALATELLPYASLFMVAVPSGALMFFALTSERRALAGVAAGLAAAMNYLCVIVIVAALWKKRRVAFLAAAAIPLFALLLYQRICFGGFFTSSVANTDPRFLTKGSVLVAPSLEALLGITISPYRGLFFFAPVLLMAIAGAFAWRGDRRELLAIGLVCAFFLGVNVCFNGWEGGFAIGARYLVPLIPLLGILLLQCRGWMKPLTVALAVLSFAINFAAVAVDPQPSGTIPRPLTQYVVPLLLHGRFSPAVPITPPWSAATFTGHTSVNRLTHDEAVVFAKHPPGSLAAEWTSFNLGESFTGAGEAASLLPIALLLTAGIAAIALAARSPESP